MQRNHACVVLFEPTGTSRKRFIMLSSQWPATTHQKPTQSHDDWWPSRNLGTREKEYLGRLFPSIPTIANKPYWLWWQWLLYTWSKRYFSNSWLSGALIARRGRKRDTIMATTTWIWFIELACIELDLTLKFWSVLGVIKLSQKWGMHLLKRLLLQIKVNQHLTVLFFTCSLSHCKLLR